MSDRKYSQRGYMDSGAARAPRDASRQRGGAPRREGPRGRGLGAPTKEVFRCRDCGERAAPSDVSFETSCSRCGAALHSCVNCSQFDTSASFECLQPIPKRIASKIKKNECELYRPKVTMERESDTSGPAPTAGKAAFDALFD